MSENGKIINQAYDILNKTYKEINRLKDDIGDLLNEYDESIKYSDEYSYSPNSLFLKPNHTFLFKQKADPQMNDSTIKALVIICIFDEFWGLDRVNLKDEPEIWVGYLDINNQGTNCRATNAHWMLSVNHRKFFNKELMIGGETFHYNWKEETAKSTEESKDWKGKFVGYPLVEIADRDAIKLMILDKLF